MDISEFVNQSRNLGLEYAVLHNWRQPTPSWTELQSLYDPSTEHGRISLNNKILTDNIKYFLDQSIGAYPNTKYDLYILESNSYRNLDPANSGTNMHEDLEDVLHWQCRGVTEWVIGKNLKTILLEPGDLIWFQADTSHKTSNLTEKCSLIFIPTKIE